MSNHQAIEIGNRRELFVDEYLIDHMAGGAELRLHEPTPQEIVFRTDRPWEGNMSTYVTIFRDGEIVRMYYTGWGIDLNNTTGDGALIAETTPRCVCYAESRDGLRWTRPELELYEHDGTKANNIIWQGKGEQQHGVSGFSPVKDTNPGAPASTRYKAIGADRHAMTGHLYALASPDGIHWDLLQEEPILYQGRHGKFDSPNRAFWDSIAGCYRIYFRDYLHGEPGAGGCRAIKTATSPDFVHWREPEWLAFPGAPEEELYTNQVQPYYRAPHILLGFPSRYIERPWSPAIEALPESEHRRLRAKPNPRFGSALTEGLFMSSRDGQTFNRWGEAFIRPGPQLEGNWAYGDNYQCWGMIETASTLEGAPEELSFFAREGRWRGDSVSFRRYSIRKDGFVSVKAPLSGGEFVTRPLTFIGDALEINFATSAAGSIRIEIQDAEGTPFPGFALEDCYEQIGNEIDRLVFWKNDPDLSALQGKPVRIRFVLHDADLYAMRFN